MNAFSSLKQKAPSILKDELVLLVLSTLCISSYAFFNEFPLLTGDSAVYIESAFSFKAMAERPVFYGIFLRISSLGISLWGVVLIQNLLLSWLMIKLIRLFLPTIKRAGIFLIVLAITVMTGMAWESNKIMPDIFAPILIVSMLLFLLEKRAFTQWVLAFIVLWSAAMHNSHFVMGIIMVAILWVISFSRRNVLQMKRLLAVSIIVLLAPIGIVLSNVWSGNGAVLGKATSVFLCGKLCENGMLQLILDDKCETSDWKMCKYRNELPHTAWQFVWDPQSPVMKEGGWDNMDKELNAILLESVSKFRYMALLVLKSIQTTMVQLAQVSSGDALFRYEETDNTVVAIKKHFPSEVNPALWTRQRILELDFKKYNAWYLRIFGILLILTVFNWKSILDNKNRIQYIVFICFGVLINAFVTSNLANISSRLQARVFFLIPFILIMVLIEIYLKKYRPQDFFEDVDKEEK